MALPKVFVLIISIMMFADIATSHWTDWSPWSHCSRTCNTGSQYRTRLCQYKGIRRYKCYGSRYETRICMLSATCSSSFSSHNNPAFMDCFDPTDTKGYRGFVSKTKSGFTCQRWDVQYPHEHFITPASFPNSGLQNNYCRNPDGDKTPWCFTTDPLKQWEYCYIKPCSEISVTTTTKYILPTTLPPARMECGRPDVPISDHPIHIVGGIEAKMGSIPWQASLRRSFSVNHFCGGSLIDKDWIITAAHCITEPQTPSSYYALLGDHHQYTNDATEQRVEFSKIFNHEQFDPFTLHHDISLMKMRTPVTFNSYIKPICLPKVNVIPLPNRQVKVSGWGLTKGTGDNSHLRYTTVPIVGDRRCKELLPRVTPQMICAGWEQGGKDSCQGDSGGPLFRQSRQGHYTLIGIVSWGNGCALRNNPGVYTRVSHYKPWILNKMANN